MKRHPARISRRNFLAIGAAAAAGCATRAVAPPPVSAEAVRLGVIGCGARGQGLIAEALSRVEPDVPVHVMAVSDACAGRRDKIAAVTRAASVKRWQNLIERRDIDAVIIATPDHLHAPISIAAMQAGKDVYCERPMALSLADAAAFRDTAARTGRVVQIGAHQTSEGQWHAARDIMSSGRLGKLRWCQGRYDKSSELLPQTAASSEEPDWDLFADGKTADPDRFFNWRKYKDYSGGVAWSDLYWKLAALLVATDTPEQEWPVRVSAAGGVYSNDGREVYDSFVLNAEFAAGHTIVLASSMAGNRERPAMIRGEAAAVEFNGNSIAVIGDGGYGESEQIAVAARQSHLDNWLDCVRSREKCVCDVNLGYRTSAIIAMAMQACSTGTSVAMHGASGSITTVPARV